MSSIRYNLISTNKVLVNHITTPLSKKENQEKSASYDRQRWQMLQGVQIRMQFNHNCVKIISVLAQGLEMFYLNSTLDFGIPPVLVFQLEVYCNVDRLLTGLAAQQKAHGIQINHIYLSFETKLDI